MKTVVDNRSCYVEIADIKVFANRRIENWPRPRLPVLEGAIAFRDTLVEVTCLLDTGCDITIVNPKKLRELERLRKLETRSSIRLPQRRIEFFHEGLQKAFDLAFIFPGSHRFTSRYGFIVPSSWDFDVADVWLGQDILNQLEVTFDGVHGTVTIIEP